MTRPANAGHRVYTLSRGAVGGWLETRDATRARPADVSDLDFVSELHTAEFPATYASAAHLVLDPDLFTFVVERDGAPIGYASGRLAGDGTGTLDYMAVAPGARGLGDGSVLLAVTLRALFADRSVERVRLRVDEGRAPAIRFYEGHGFTRDGS